MVGHESKYVKVAMEAGVILVFLGPLEAEGEGGRYVSYCIEGIRNMAQYSHRARAKLCELGVHQKLIHRIDHLDYSLRWVAA